MGNGGGPWWSLLWEKTSTWKEQCLTYPFPQKEAGNAGHLTMGPSVTRTGHVIKRLWLTMSASLFYCLRVLRIGDPKDRNCMCRAQEIPCW